MDVSESQPSTDCEAGPENEQASEKSFLKAFLYTSLLTIGALSCLTTLVDPYNFFGLNTMGNYISSEREFKASEIGREKWKYVLMGNSKSGMVDTSVLPQSTFNAAFGSGKPHEFYHFIERYLHDPDTTVILGLDIFRPGAALPPDAEIPFARKSFSEVMSYVISLKAVEFSFKTIVKYFKGEPTTLKENGDFGSEKRWASQKDLKDDKSRQYELNRLIKTFEVKTHFEEEDYYYYKKLADLLRIRNIPVLVFLHPFHEEVIKKIRLMPHYPKIAIWKKRMNEIFQQQIVDFSETPFSDSDNFFYADPVHYRPAVGAKLMKKLPL